jgi:hypothetical protein
VTKPRWSKAWLLVAGLLSEAVYLATALRLSWWRYGSGLTSWSEILGQGWGPFVLCLTGIGLLMALYLLGWRVLRRASPGAGMPRMVRGFALLFAATLFWLLPITSDLFNYLTKAYLFTDLDANPLLSAPRDYPGDRLLMAYPTPYSTEPSVYGPAWTLLSAPATLGRYDLIGGLIYLKSLAAFAYLGIVWLLERILRQIRPAAAMEGVYLFAWNPLVLLLAVGDGHNDIVMMATVLLAVWLLLHNRWTLAFGTLALSVWIKYTSVIFVPLFVVYTWWRLQERDARDPRPVLILGGLAAAGTTAVVFAPFWRAEWIVRVAERILWSDSWHGGASGLSAWLMAAGAFLFTAVYAILLRRVVGVRGSFRRLAEIGFEVSLLAFVLGVARSQPWHLIWPAALAGFSGRWWAWPAMIGLSGLMLVAQVWVEWGTPGIR